MSPLRLAATAACLVLAGSAACSGSALAKPATEVYDSFGSGAPYTAADYAAKWANPYGLGEMALTDTRSFAGGKFAIKATPFRTGSDFGVYDHLKYIGISTKAFPVPGKGVISFSGTIKVATPGTVPNLIQHGVYGPTGSWTDPLAPPPLLKPYAAKVLEGQQAGAVMNVIDFCTGQLFDWFVSGKRAFALIERLPTAVTGNTSNPNCPGATEVGIGEMYTQIIREVPVGAGPHKVTIAYSHKGAQGVVAYALDGIPIAAVNHVGVPLDQQQGPLSKYTGIYPSLGKGEPLGDQIHSFQIGHGLFSLLDAFPFQHPGAPQLSVSIPVGTANPSDAGRARLFGQGADAKFDDFTVSTLGS